VHLDDFSWDSDMKLDLPLHIDQESGIFLNQENDEFINIDLVIFQIGQTFEHIVISKTFIKHER